MLRKKITLRFDLECPEDRRAWEYLQGLNGASMNKSVLAIINQAEQASRIRNVVREQLAAALERLSVQPVQTGPEADDETDNTLMDFLENFS